jgi:hypothetical protein
MYTFQPLASIPVDHTGFLLILVTFVFWLAICVFIDSKLFFSLFFVATLITGMAYGVSYHWTNQEPETFANTPVVGEFVGYQPEGYNESRTSGKNTRRVDVHHMYVVYSVNGNLVILDAQVGAEYPKRVQLYKN